MHQIAFSQWAHDIRNALGTIALYVETLDCPENPKSGKTVAATQALLARVAAMCSAAAMQSRDGAQATTRATFDIARTIAQVRELIGSTLPAAVSLQAETTGTTRVTADALDVFRILFNLLHNAATVARQSGALNTIRVRVEQAEATAIITVSDDGPGLPESVRKKLFRTGRSLSGGSGHGLAIARELAERNGGTLRLADTSQGTTFVIELPLDPATTDRVASLYRAREQRAAANSDKPVRGAA